MEAIIYNQKSLEVYRNNFKYYFTLETIDETYDGEIVLGTGNHGGETYKYVSHIEFDDEELNDVETEALEKYFDDNLNEVVFNAPKI